MLRRLVLRPVVLGVLGAIGFVIWLIPSVVRSIPFYSDWGSPGRNPRGFVAFDAAVAGAVLAAAVLMLLLNNRAARYVPWVTTGASVVSLGVTIYFVTVVRFLGVGSLSMMIDPMEVAETWALILLLVATMRSSPIRVAVPVVVLGAIAAMLVHLRLFIDGPASLPWLPPWYKDNLGQARASWVLIGIGIGGYLRWQDAERVRAADAARRMQRLALAQDLHDFVAHDLSGMVVQAQAAQVTMADDSGQVRDALHRIEQAGLHALAAMDRTVRMLHEFGTPAGGGLALADRVPGAGLAELAPLTARFTDTGPAQVALDIAGDVDSVPAEVGATAYRIVAEALTNVRRHAPDATLVRVRIDCGDDTLTLIVADDGAAARSGAPTARQRGGFGLTALAERVEALHGTFEAGPNPGGGWRVRTSLPLDGQP